MNLMYDYQEKEKNKKGSLSQIGERKRQWECNLLECVTRLKKDRQTKGMLLSYIIKSKNMVKFW
jgi:hypothetical protein